MSTLADAELETLCPANDSAMSCHCTCGSSFLSEPGARVESVMSKCLEYEDVASSTACYFDSTASPMALHRCNTSVRLCTSCLQFSLIDSYMFCFLLQGAEDH